MKILDLLLEQDNDEILRRVIKGFKLVHTKEAFGDFAFLTQAGTAHPTMVSSINNWIKKIFPHSGLRAVYEKNYGTINFYVKQDNITETE